MTKRVVVIGNGIEAQLCAALIARLLRGLCTVELVPAGRSENDTVALPPTIDAAHRFLGISHDTIRRAGRPRYGITIRSREGDIHIPYGRYGIPQREDFAGQWLRLSQQRAAQPLAAYSANAALLAGGKLRDGADPLVVQSIVAGWDVDAAAYGSLLEGVLEAHHVRRTAPLARAISREDAIAGLTLGDGTSLRADLYVDASQAEITGGGAAWERNVICVGSTANRFESPEPFSIAATLSAAARIVNLLPRVAAMPLLAAEYKRLFDAERDAMAAADAALLRIADRGKAAPPLLRQHEDSYRAAGALPLDGQPWGPDQWLSCFDAIGLAPARHDPNAARCDRHVAASELSHWATKIAQAIDPGVAPSDSYPPPCSS